MTSTSQRRSAGHVLLRGLATLALASCVAAAGFVAAGLSSPTATRIVDITKSTKIVTREQTIYISDADPHRCVLVTFAQYPAVTGATSYSVLVKGVSPSHDVQGGGPPYPYDHYVVGGLGGGKTITFDAPSASHWLFVSSGATGTGDCSEGRTYTKDHFSIAKATATVTGSATSTSTSTTTSTQHPKTCSGVRTGPVMGTRGGRLIVIRRAVDTDVTVNGKPTRIMNNAYVSGKLRIKTGPKGWFSVGAVDGPGGLVLVAPGTTVEFEPGQRIRVLQSTPGLSDKRVPVNVGRDFKVRTNGCVLSARG